MSSSEFQKPKPRLRALTIHELRSLVSARHKACVETNSIDEGVELLQEHYTADTDSCLAFIGWIQGGPADGAKDTPVERIHRIADPKTGEERVVETLPGSIPPRSV